MSCPVTSLKLVKRGTPRGLGRVQGGGGRRWGGRAGRVSTRVTGARRLMTAGLSHSTLRKTWRLTIGAPKITDASEKVELDLYRFRQSWTLLFFWYSWPHTSAGYHSIGRRRLRCHPLGATRAAFLPHEDIPPSFLTHLLNTCSTRLCVGERQKVWDCREAYQQIERSHRALPYTLSAEGGRDCSLFDCGPELRKGREPAEVGRL